MYLPSDENPTRTKAHFLKPLFSEHDDHFPPPPSSLLSSEANFKLLKNSNLHSYKSSPSEKWKIWVLSLKPKYQEIWKQAGIYEAIMASTYKIRKNTELILGLAERWCAETNTFILPWGEVTITLEDVMFLGGYSVLGALYLTPLADEGVGIFDCLKSAYDEVRLLSGGNVIASMWMEYFLRGSKELEHEAFLAMWLSRFVLVRSYGNIAVHDFHVAIHLSRGKRIALAPVVLASIYRDMRVLQNSTVKYIKSQSQVRLRLILCHADLVHMWAWERFPKLRPSPVVINTEEPRSARWNGVKIRKVRDVRKALDSEKDSFLWRPYVITSSNCTWSKLYRDSEQWLVVESEDAESLARCLRVSELVGLDYIEQYLPHRVAMQFGLDQDIPPHVMRSNGSPKTAWSTYKRSIRGTQLYIPPRHFQSNVSSRYVVWWRGLLPANKEIGTTCIRNEKHFPLISWGQKRRRSRKMESFGKRNNLDGMLVVKTYCGTETPAKLICLTEAVTSGVQSKSSSDKCKERISSTERPINLKEDAVVSDGNQVKVNEATAELANDVVRKVNSPDNHIVNIEEKSCGSTTSELAHLGLMARILRLEKIVDAIKAAKRDANSGGNFEH
ncbi:hypothetical protein DCAR_0415619 [Daucus carota subsp. sativus]|uniref:Aminotransferase-like plant mobile domain-containing protein n=1 Tax=Daucus carota subsp. sativus TaxID=79200 RepID=A0AAF1AXR9_DAUCS|nr:hypothetical protein DCAR_0415619 [Daucus carota subsp. sativus]